MNLRRLIVGLGVLLWASIPLAAQTENDPPPARTPIPTEGFWPTARMMDRIIDRISDEMGNKYEFDDEQLERTRTLLKERFPAFLNENRGEIQSLVNQFFEAQLAGEAPTPEIVATWAQRVQPLLNRFTKLATDTAGEMREYMTDDQALRLEGELAAFETGVRLVNNKLGIWSSGGYDPKTEWMPDARSRKRRDREVELKLRAEMDQARQTAIVEASGAEVAVAPVAEPAPQGNRPNTPAQPAKPAPPKDEWEKYVDAFVTRYALTAEQTQDARRLLVGKQKERDEYLTRRKDDLADIQKRLTAAKEADEKKSIQAELDKFQAPVERMFQQLKDRVDRIPTPTQRRKAAEADNNKKPDPVATDAPRPAAP